MRVFVAGHGGMVGSAICRALGADRAISLVTASRSDLDLTDQRAVTEFFERNNIDEVYLAAAKVGGIFANDSLPAEFIYRNLMIQTNVINAAFTHGVKKLLFLGSSCIYPKLAKQPITEAALLTGLLELTNEPYAIAKIAGIKLCESYNRQYGVDYRSIMPTNLYGPGDNYHPDQSHVIPALIRRFHVAKNSNASAVKVWGSGNVKREFLFVDDLAAACIFLMGLEKDVYLEITGERMSHVNCGTGEDITIRELATFIAETVGFKGALEFDTSMPDGTPRKLLDVGTLKDLGWVATTPLEEGLKLAYKDFVNQQ